jgi:uncharacterized membrane protein YeaQ/YmgE (transglycosylase-associated protein family)
LIIWLIIAALVGFVGELLARRRTTLGIVGAIIVGFIAIFLVVGIFHWHIVGEPYLNGVPLIISFLAAAVLVAIWSAFAYRHAYGYIRVPITGVAAITTASPSLSLVLIHDGDVAWFTGKRELFA